MRVTVGCGDDADLRGQFLLAADARVAPGFQHPQQANLHFRRHLDDLVEKESPAGCALETTAVQADRVGEGTLLVAEELGLDQAVRNGAAIERQERRLRTCTRLVNRVRNQFLAAARFTRDEYRGECRRDAGDASVKFLHGHGAAQQTAEAPECGCGCRAPRRHKRKRDDIVGGGIVLEHRAPFVASDRWSHPRHRDPRTA